MTTQTKFRIHQQYFDKAGNRLPGVTTVLSILAKPALIHWAWGLGIKGIDYRKHRDSMADIGTLAHLMVLNYFKGIDSTYSDYSKDDIDKAENCLISFYSWVKENRIEPICVEEQFISEMYGYGGTVDLYCKFNGVLTLVDFKTSKAIYEEMFYQVAAYRQLLIEAGKKVLQARILRIGREEDEGFDDHQVLALDENFTLFKHALEIYKLKNKLKKEVF